MALKESVVDGDQILMDHGTETRIFLSTVEVVPAEGNNPAITVVLRNIETTETKSEKWVALTAAAAETERAANVQPEDEDARNTYAVSIDNEIIRSYSLMRTYQKVTRTSSADLDPAPDVTFSPGSGLYPEGAKDITLNCSDADAWINYTTGTNEEPPDPTTGSPVVPAGGTISITIPTAGGYVMVKAIARKLDSALSNVTSATYTDDEVE